VTATRKLFGSWPAAVEAAGVPRFKRGRWTSWALVRGKLRELAAADVKMSTSSLIALGLGDLVTAAIGEAGTWNQALDRAGVELVMARRTWTREQVLDGILGLQARGIALGYNVAIARGHGRLVKAAIRIFGTWHRACAAALPGFEPTITRWTRPRLLARLRARHREGKSMRSTEVFRDEQTLLQAARRLGLEWKEACRRAGVPAAAYADRPPPPTRIRWTADTIVDHLRREARRGTSLVGRNFSSSFVQSARLRFVTWEKAMAAAGLAARYRQDVAKGRANRLGGRFEPGPK
jgi:hypothetical protein